MNCRLCLFECNNSDAVELFPKDEEIYWTKLIIKYLFIVVKENDSYSTTICRICSKHLENFHDFFQYIEHRQKLLKNDLKIIWMDETAKNHVDESEESPLDVNYLSLQEEPAIENPLSLPKDCLNDSNDDEDVKYLSSQEEPSIENSLSLPKDCLNDNNDDEGIKYLSLQEEPTIENPLSLPKACLKEKYLSSHENRKLPTLPKACLKDKNVGEHVKYLSSHKKPTLPKACLKDKNVGEDCKDKEDLVLRKICVSAASSKAKKPKSKGKEGTTKRYLNLKNYDKEIEDEEKMEDELIARYMEMRCELCGALTDTYRSLKIHSRTEHAVDGFISCCGVRFKIRRELLDHIQAHLNPDYLKCDICNKILKSRSRLAHHKSSQHFDGQDFKFACEVCQKRFSCSSNLMRHMVAHSMEKNHICSVCNKGFKSKYFLNAHKKTHKETNQYVCENCGKEYRNKAAFERHIAIHDGHFKEPKSECSICGKWLTQYCLPRHMLSHTLEDIECKVCGKMVKSKNALRGHMDYAHNKREIFTCTFCSKTFKRSSVLKEHISLHTGSKDYHCKHCPQDFRSKANMYAHVKKVHVQEWTEAQLLRFKGPD